MYWLASAFYLGLTVYFGRAWFDLMGGWAWLDGAMFILEAIATVMCVAAAALNDDSWVSKETLGAAFFAGIGWLGVLNFSG